MSKRPWMPFYVADYLADTLDLSTEQTGVYMLLLLLCWRQGGTIPNDMPRLKLTLSRCVIDMHGNRFNRLVPPLLARYFQQDETGNWYQKRLRNELEKAENYSENQKEKSEKRWAGHNKNNGLGNATGYAPVMPARASSQSHSQSTSFNGAGKKAEFEVAWVPEESAEFAPLSQRWFSEKGKKVVAMGSRNGSGLGHFFPADWVRATH